MSFPHVELPGVFHPELGDDLYAASLTGLAGELGKLRGERDTLYRAINALVRKYAGGTAHLDPAEIAREEPVITVEFKTVMEGFTVTVRPLR